MIALISFLYPSPRNAQFPNKMAFAGLLILASSWGRPLFAADWPQLLGPDRNSRVSVSEAPLEGLPAKLPSAWEIECGEGYAGPAVSGDSVYIFDRVADQERVRRIAKKDGQVIWSQQWPADYSGGVDSDRGPRCVPTVASDYVIAYGAAGRLACLSVASGDVIWKRPIRAEYQADDGYFGAGSSPLVVNQTVIVNVGGKKKGGIVAVSLKDGKTIWESVGAEASYASPITMQVKSSNSKGNEDAMKQLVLVPTRLTTYGIDPVDGKVAFEFPFGARGPTVNGATPLALPNGQVFMTASYGVGAFLVEPKIDAVKFIFKGSELLSSQYSSPVAFGEFIFASDGREDQGTGQLRCIDIAKQKLLWESDKIGVAHLIAFTNTILAVGIDGQLLLFDASPAKLTVRASNKLSAGLYRALPAYSDGTLYLRNSGRGSGKLLAVPLAQ
jgi:outer membrane protein assembly factor BamB